MKESRDLLMKFLPEVDLYDLMATAAREIVRSSYNAYKLYTRMIVEQVTEERIVLKGPDEDEDWLD